MSADAAISAMEIRGAHASMMRHERSPCTSHHRRALSAAVRSEHGIGALGLRILQNASYSAAAWRGRDVEHLTLSVNVSPLQISENFSDVIAAVLERSKFPASRLELEIEESAVLESPDCTLRCIKQLKKRGVRIAGQSCGHELFKPGASVAHGLDSAQN